jgi:hypothetical protein
MEHLIKMPCGASLATRRFHLVCEAGADFVTPSPDRFIAHEHPALESEMDQRYGLKRFSDETRRLFGVLDNRLEHYALSKSTQLYVDLMVEQASAGANAVTLSIGASSSNRQAVILAGIHRLI